MIELKSNALVATFPELPLQPRLQIEFQRTLRIPDDGKDYPLPPGLGRFPLCHIDDFRERVPSAWLQRGGVLMPMWQAEALWLNFNSIYISDHEAAYPFAVKVATGKINAVTGEKWKGRLSRNPQDYMVIPGQPWLDGYCVEKGIIRQFVAMPLGQGYSAEEQVTGEAEFGGLQIEVFPMLHEVFKRRFPVVPARRGIHMDQALCICEESPGGMGLAPGGRMRQEIYHDPFSIHDWDTGRSSRCFVHLVNSTMWHGITGERPPTKPPTTKDYSNAGYPWFDYYDAELRAVQGSKVLNGLRTVKTKMQQNHQGPLPNNQTVATDQIIKLHPNLAKYQVREGEF